MRPREGRVRVTGDRAWCGLAAGMILGATTLIVVSVFGGHPAPGVRVAIGVVNVLGGLLYVIARGRLHRDGGAKVLDAPEFLVALGVGFWCAAAAVIAASLVSERPALPVRYAVVLVQGLGILAMTAGLARGALGRTTEREPRRRS